MRDEERTTTVFDLAIHELSGLMGDDDPEIAQAMRKILEEEYPEDDLPTMPTDLWRKLLRRAVIAAKGPM